MANKLSISIGRSDMHRINVNDLLIDTQAHNGRRFQPSAEKVRSLAESIIQMGQIEPIVIRKIGDTYTPVVGFTRCAAIKLINEDPELREKAGLGEDDIFPIKAISQQLNETEALLRNIAENLERNSTSPIDDAYMQERLRERLGWSNVQIAELYRCTPAQVSSLSNLLLLSNEEQMLVHTQVLTQRNAIDLSRLMPDKRQEVIQAAAVKPALEMTESITGIDGVDFDELERKSAETATQLQDDPTKRTEVIEIDNRKLGKEIAKARGKDAWRSYKEVKDTLKEVADTGGHRGDTRAIFQALYEWISGKTEIDDVLDLMEKVNLTNA